jgi:site-specific DNA-cytosine methylase
MNHLELFSGTHSFGKVSSKLNYNVVSLDRDLGAKCPFTDYLSKEHIKEDILTWNYKKYPVGHFKLITASPVCLWWSNLRNTWIGRKLKCHNGLVCTKELLEEDINKYGKPMVDKVIEIIEYFKPDYWIIENPKSGKMKNYISEKYPHYNTYNDFSYCKFSDWGYKKDTRFWNNIPKLKSCLCKKDCGYIVNNKHTANIGGRTLGNVCNAHDKYRIPENLIEYLISI